MPSMHHKTSIAVNHFQLYCIRSAERDDRARHKPRRSLCRSFLAQAILVTGQLTSAEALQELVRGLQRGEESCQQEFWGA